MRSIAFALADPVSLGRRDQLLDTAEELLAQAPQTEAWEQQSSDTWTMFVQTGQRLPAQGWKLHISATPLSAVDVLRAVLPILFREGAAFKMVSTARLLSYVNASHSSRASSGKFITVYPRDDRHATELAEACHRATDGLEGPVILSDRSYRPASLVHYRYGGFFRDAVYLPNGSLQVVIRDPDGRPVADNREAWFTPPAWVEDPFRDRQPEAEPDSPAGEIVLGGRFKVTGALGHSNKGGVYLATDLETGATVVVKEARPNVGMDLDGRDVVARLEIEHRNLETLSALGVTPRPLAFLEHQGHSFLAMERIQGSSLTRFVIKHRRDTLSNLPLPTVKSLLVRAARLLERVHGAGIVLRDFTSNNLMLLPDGELLLIDPELACAEGEEDPIAPGAGTPGYASPEQWNKGTPSRSDDCFSMGGLAYYLSTCRDPLLAKEEGPGARGPRARFREHLDLLIRDGLVPPSLATLMTGCMAEKPADRWTAKQILEFVESMSLELRPAAREQGRSGDTAPDRLQRIAHDLAAHAVECFDFGRPDRPLASSCLGEQTDPVNVQHGVAGVGSFLVSMLDHPDPPAAVRATVEKAARWTLDSIGSSENRPLGLYFGLAGAAWFVLEAAQALQDGELLASSCTLAERIQWTPPLLDVTHGAAGIALMNLRFHLATGREPFLSNAAGLGERLLEAGRVEEHGRVWPTPQSSGAPQAPPVFFGFAHGIAGIVYTLLALHCATQRRDFLDVALEGAETLVRAAELDGDCALWTHGPGQPSRWPHWCNGSSGVGTTMLRLFEVVGDERFRDLADKAANTVAAKRWWHGSNSQCHGPAGNGELLIDLHQSLGDERYLDMAHRLAEVILAQRVLRKGRSLFADDTQLMVSPDYSTGTAGIGTFLLRLAHGGPRAFMVDPLLSRGARREVELQEQLQS